MLKTTLALTLLLAFGLLSGCNTIAGFGEDIAGIGNAIQRVAD